MNDNWNSRIHRKLSKAPPDNEKNAICFVICDDGAVHAYRQLDDAPLAARPVCEAGVTPVADQNPRNADKLPPCKPCALWAFTWAGSKDPEGDFARSGSKGKR